MHVLERVTRLPVTPDIVAVIPAHNEERFIASVVITALQCADVVVVVDDGSSDRTAQLAEMAGAEVIRLPENGGKGRALNEGFERAQELSPRAVVMLDGDSQHDAAEIPQLVRPITEGEADVVIGSRFLGDECPTPRWRQAGQQALNLLTNAASGMSTSDSQSGYRAFSLPALEKLWFRSKGLAMESEMQFLAHRASLRVVEVPVSVHYLDGNKRNPVTHGLQVVDAILGLVARRHPLLFMGIPGIASMLIGLLVGVSVLQIIDMKHAVPLGTATLSALLVITGLVLGIAGVILNTLEHFMSRLQLEFQTILKRAPAASGPRICTDYDTSKD
ncbi:MAG: glycosyltransferase family 2 protein [Chloroflexota bacterium]